MICAEKASGTRRDGRTELQVLLDFLRPGDALAVTRIDRLARSLRDLQNIVHELKERRVTLRATEQPIDTGTAAGKAFLDMLGVFAEFETNLRKKRQAEGIAAAKARGVYKGRKAKIDATVVRKLRYEEELGPAEIETAMNNAADRYRYVLQRPIIEPPGKRWIYNGGATALLARLIEKGTGRQLHEFAREVLFEPLQIENTEWRRGIDGEPIAASGLRLKPRDLARIGTMILGGGQWNGRQVIPAEWLEVSFAPAISMPDGQQYGYQWYLSTIPMDDGAGGVRREKTINAIGNGGQRLFLLPRLDLVVAVTAGNYDDPNQGRPPTIVLRDLILPALRAG